MIYKNKRKVAVFDLDGTLIDSKPKLITDVREAFARLGKQITPKQASENWYELAEKYGFSREQFDESFDKRKTWGESLRAGEVTIFPETYETLNKLRQNGTRLAFLSKSKPKYTFQKLGYFSLLDYFEQIAVVDPRKPSKVRDALRLIKSLDPETIEKAYFIGDREEDVDVADIVNRKYQIPAVGIYVDREGSAPQHNHIKSLDEVLEFI